MLYYYYNAHVKGHLEPTHLKSSPLFTFSTKSLGHWGQKVTFTKNTITRPCLFVCLFVCLTGRSVRRHTWVLMGPDSNKMLQARLKRLYKHAGQLVYGNVREREQIWRQEMKEKKTTATPNKSSWTILMSLHNMILRLTYVHQLETLYLCYGVKYHSGVIWGHGCQKVIFTKNAIICPCSIAWP